MMIESITVINENDEKIKINILIQFRVEELNREYIAYTVNDDGVSEDVQVFITGIKEENGETKLVLIPEEEKILVLAVYDNIRDNLAGER